MKVTLLSTYDTFGGAGVAASRLHRALQKNGTASALLVAAKQTATPEVAGLAQNWVDRKLNFGRFALERLAFLPYERDKSVRFQFSPAAVGADLSGHPLVQAADILHLHWTQFGFLSLNGLEKLVKLGKPLVWTLHDMWAFTGGCHYSGGCQRFLNHCQNCPLLRGPHALDLSWRIFEKKRRILAKAPLHVVACSGWLADTARRSHLLGNFPVQAIPNPIDTQIYQPGDAFAARQALGLPLAKKLLLFGAVNTADPRKGFDLLQSALQYLATDSTLASDVEVVVFGKADPTTLNGLPSPVHALGSLQGDAQLVSLYQAADALVLPSREDNLPNTVMEALACGRPAVAFQTGGLSDLIDHQNNGFLAEPFSPRSLAEGITFVLNPARTLALQLAARHKVLGQFAEPIVAQRYLRLYQSLLSPS